MTEDQEYIYDSLVNQIKMGFFPVDEIKDMIWEQVEDEGMEDDISEKWVNQTINTEFKKHQEASKGWKSPTDTERLVKAFNELSKSNIIALHNAGYTTSEGEYEVVEVEIELRKQQIQSDGYCFYHQQDLERAIDPDSRNLMIAFQKIDNSDDAVTIEIGEKVAKKLKDNGFEIIWNGTALTKIEIPNFDWQKVYSESEENLLNHNRVLQFMVK